MYVDFPSVMMMIMGILIGFAVGVMTGSRAGLTISVLAGLAIACIGIVGYQAGEIEAWQYAHLERIRGDDCRVAPMIKNALADRRISMLEYNRIMDVVERNDLVDARDSLAQVSQRQCVTG